MLYRHALTACCLCLLLAKPTPALAAVPELSVKPEASQQLTQAIEDNSVFLRKDKPEITADDLPYRLREDMATLHDVLAASGYYDPVVTYLPAGQLPAEIKVDTGPQYLLGRYSLTGLPADNKLEDLPATGQPALADRLLETEQAALHLLGEHGYPLAKFSARNYIVRHDTRTLNATLIVQPGPLLGFGDIEVTGNMRVRTAYLQRIAPWTKGQTYNASTVNSYRDELAATNLFTRVTVTPAPASPDGKHLPLKVDVTERPPRTIGGSVGYDSDHGAGVEMFWQHRNLRGQAEQIDVTGKIYSRLQEIESRFRVPRWPDNATTLNLGLNMLNEQSDAFNQTGITFAAGLERKLNHIWTTAVDTRLSLSSVDSELVTQLALPFSLRGDTSDDKLNPTRGWRSETLLTPVLALSGEKALYATWEQRLSGYLPLDKNATHVLAGWTHLGGTIDAARDSLAPTSRFYSGGGGSVRGYEYRSIGDKQATGDPLGGTAVFEGGAEVRSWITKTIGAVVFAEFGSISNSALPTFDKPQYAAGVGVRYLTGIAPVRFDVATPLNPREEDSKVQFYISIGQAF